MATQKQREAARRNVKKAQAAWKAMSPEQHARAQPQGRGRQKPGTTGEGEFYRVVVRPKEEFVTFRTQDVGGPAAGPVGEHPEGPGRPARDGEGVMIRKLKTGQYRLYSRKVDPKTGKRRNLGTFDTREAAEKHERAVQFFKHK